MDCCASEDVDGAGESSILGTKKMKKHSNMGALTSDVILAKDLESLSFKERENVYEELHGVAGGDNLKLETPGFLAKKMKALKKHISSIPPHERKAYDRALFLNPTLLDDQRLKLLFLRSEKYEVAPAALRICQYFTRKLELWGDEKLGRRITLDDLSEDDMSCLRSGSYGTLPQTDSAGRLVLIVQCSKIKFCNWRNWFRSTWYQLMSAFLDSHEAHAKGCVSILTAIGIDSKAMAFTRDLMLNGLQFTKILPRHTVGIHLCHDSLFGPFSIFTGKSSTGERLHTRIHYGSILETKYTLMTFGIRIPKDYFSENPELIERYVNEFLERQREREEIIKLQRRRLICEGRIPYLTHKDVLVGRGKQNYDFPGNLIMHQYVEEFSLHYDRAGEWLDKKIIVMTVIKKVRDGGGRFLERKADHWALANEAVATRKVSQAFRARLAGKATQS